MTASTPTFQKTKTGALLCCLVLLGLGCQPSDEQPGLWLSGQAVSQPPGDWRFTQEIEEIFIETRPWYGLPHSTTIWCVEVGGALYIGSYGEEKKAWEEAVAHNPEARLEIDGLLYTARIDKVTDKALGQQLNRRYFEKYDMHEVFGEDVPEWWFYRVTPGAGSS